MTSTAKGRKAEQAVADYLRTKQFRIISKNWRTPTCEIDLIAAKYNVIFFIEVKFRSNARQGDGFAYITDSKLRRMKYGARLWSVKNNWPGERVISCASVSGPDFDVEFIEQI